MPPRTDETSKSHDLFADGRDWQTNRQAQGQPALGSRATRVRAACFHTGPSSGGMKQVGSRDHSLDRTDGRVVQELKFIRDNIECKDITMDSRRKLFVNPRESTSLIREDIQGTSSKQLHKERKGLYSAGAGVPPQPLDQLYVTDIA